jgi:hypothetical protein
MKPVVALYAESNVVGMYKLGQYPDSITKDLVQKFPTFVAYEEGVLKGKQEGAMPIEQLDNTFNPSKSSVPTGMTPINEATMLQLQSNEALLIDQVSQIRGLLREVQNEMKRRRKLAEEAF